MLRAISYFLGTRHSSLATFVLLLSLAFPASAQVTTGMPPFGSFSGGPDVINLGNLNGHITIPILHKSGRGTAFTYDLSYDSSVWYPVSSGSTQTWQAVSNWGWHAATEALAGYVTGYQTYSYCYTLVCQSGHCHNQITGTTTRSGNWVYHDPFGIPHPFVGSTVVQTGTCGGINNPSFQATATDGSGYSLSVANSGGQHTVFSRDGTIINAPYGGSTGSGGFTDRNGNQITASSSGVFTDTLGTTVLTVSGSGTPASPVEFTYTAPSGASPYYQLNYTNYTVATNFGTSIHEYKSQAAVPLPTSMVLPDGSQYTFTYEPTPSTPSQGACTPYAGTTCVTARLASITFPTGGTISYAYYNSNNNFPACTTGNNGIFSDGSASCLQRTTPDGTWTYVRSLVSGTQWQTLLTDPTPAANQTLLYFQKDSATGPSTNNFYETQRLVYQGSGNLLRQWTTCYNGNTANCTTTAVSSPITQRNVTDQYGPSGLQCQHNYFYPGGGGLAEQDDYDYGSGGPGGLLRQILITYASLGNNITAFQQTVTVKNGSGTTISQTTYNYDEPNTLTATSGILQHTSVYGSRGNLTSINYPVSGLTSHFTYYDTGSPNTSQDVNGATTTFNYSNNTADCQMAFPTSISEPLSLSRSMTWNCTGGVLTSLTDENSQVSSVTYNDAYFWRQNGTTDQLGNQTAISYQPNPSYCCPWMVASALSFNNGNSLVEDVQYKDGLGRTYVDQHPQGPNSSTLDSVSYTFDSNGRPYSVSMPCSIGYAGTCSTPKTTQTYDALNRPLQTTDAGSGTVTYTYNQNDALVNVGPAPSGENTKQRQLEYDALGRLTSVCELTAGTSLWPSASCGQNTAATGYLTKYTYDALGNLLTVTQNAQSGSNQQTRSYASDAMGRLTSETNPESGTTTYVYDTIASGNCAGTYNGDLIKKVDAAGNVTCTVYDALHRPTSVTYRVAQILRQAL